MTYINDVTALDAALFKLLETAGLYSLEQLDSTPRSAVLAGGREGGLGKGGALSVFNPVMLNVFELSMLTASMLTDRQSSTPVK